MFPVGLALQEELSELSGVVEESVTGVRVVKGFGAERLQRAAGSRPRPTACTTGRWSRRSCACNFMPLIDFLPTLGLVGILWYGGHQVLDGNLIVGDIVAANLYVLMMIWPLRMVGMLVGAAAAFGRRRPAASTRCSSPIPRSTTSRTARGRCPTVPARCGSRT